ncbi:MAG: serine racemase VanT catalytic subunit [Lachnospiraceae bacterium]|jgi:alanine racemase|nr:serine racemase VanT catalytic subunit [Lachnospiraceae bacterium]
MYQKGRAWVELNRHHLAHNLEQFKKILSIECEIMPAIKANAYGHGAVLVAKMLQDLGIESFCVASVDEAIELREAGILGQILILSYTSPYRFSELRRYSLTQTVVDCSYAEELNDYGENVEVHIGVDTGMHRLGERSDNIENICKIWECDHLNITGVFSHLCVSDGNSETEREFTLKQISEFNSVVTALHKRGICGFKTHIQGSYGILNYPFLRFDYARPGIALYGAFSTPHDRLLCEVELKPVLSLKARVECVKRLYAGEAAGYGLTYTAKREMKIAAVSIGYADGIPRELSNKGFVLVNGQKAAMIGRICMDQLLIDVSEVSGVSPGDEVVFIGKSGGHEILASDFAYHANTISNEILSRLGNRLERVLI